MFVATRRQVIKDREGHVVTEEMIAALDRMLTEYGVEHYFALPCDADEDGYAPADHVYDVFYDGDKDELTFDLVFVLWSRVYRGYDDALIKRGLQKTIEGI